MITLSDRVSAYSKFVDGPDRSRRSLVYSDAGAVARLQRGEELTPTRAISDQ